MGILGQILLGLLMVGAGILILKNNYQVANNLRLAFIEDHMGPGSSYLVWKILAVLIVLLGFTVMFGFFDDLLGFILSPVINLINPNT